MPILQRPDGRKLAYEVQGDPADPLVFSLHGTPGGRLAVHPVVAGACVVSFDRPGYGDSDPQPGRSVASVAAEVAGIADALGADRFTVLGISGGGPHALACAALLPDRVTKVASLVGVAPAESLGTEFTAGMTASNIAEFAAAYAGRDALAEMLEPIGTAISGNPDGLADLLAAEVSPADRASLADPELRSALATTMIESLRPGVDGWIDDDLAFVTGWGFDPGTIAVPTLIWQGEEDTLVPVAHAHWLHKAIPQSRLITVPGAGHLASFGVAASVVGWLTNGTEVAGG